MIPFVADDGGRTAAGFRGETGDCAVRAVAIATGQSYRRIYDELNQYARDECLSRGRKSSSRTGVWRETMDTFMRFHLGATWVPTMTIGSGCQVHVRRDELPGNCALVLRLSRHYAAVIDGVLHDTSDCSRNGTRCVYGYWVLPE